jgi:hypothetical protein
LDRRIGLQHGRLHGAFFHALLALPDLALLFDARLGISGARLARDLPSAPRDYAASLFRAGLKAGPVQLELTALPRPGSTSLLTI